MVTSTPNHTGSQPWNWISGSSRGRNTMNTDTPSRNMPMSLSTMSTTMSVPTGPSPSARNQWTMGSARPMVLMQ
ncbi:hypothetical protein D3C80_2209100 [compost metagenome]